MNTEQKVDFLEQKVALLTSRIELLEQRLSQGGMAQSQPQQQSHHQPHPNQGGYHQGGNHSDHYPKKKKGMGSMLGDIFD